MIAEAIYKTLIFGGPTLDAALCVCMLHKRRLQTFPALFTFSLLDLIASVALYTADSSASSPLYARLYLTYDILSFILQIWILFEIARSVLRPAGIWSRKALKPLAILGSLGAILAFAATFLLQPSGIHGPEAIQLRAEIFTSLLACELVIAMMLSAKEVGLPWRSHVMAVGQALMLWSLVAATEEGFSAYLGPHNRYYQALYYVRGVNYIVLVLYWTVSLWREEPARRPISPALRKYIVALHDQVQYDLGKAGH